MISVLEKAGFTKDCTIAFIKRCTLPEEQVFVGKLGDAAKWDLSADYFSVAIVKRSPVPIHWKNDGDQQ